MILLLILLASMQDLDLPSMPEAKSTVLLKGGVDLLMFSPDSRALLAFQFSETAVLSVDESRELYRIPGMPVGYPTDETVVLLSSKGLEVRGGPGWQSVLTAFDLPEDRTTALGVDRRSDQMLMAQHTENGIEFLKVSFSGELRRLSANLGCTQVDRLAFRRGNRLTLVVAACKSSPVLEVLSIEEGSEASPLSRLYQIAVEDIEDPGPAGFSKGRLLITQDSRYLVSSHFDQQLRVWRLNDGGRLNLETSAGSVVGLLEAPDEDLILELVAEGRRRRLQMRQMPGFTRVAALSDRFSLPFAMSLSDAGDLAVSSFCPRDESIQLPDGRTVTREKRQPCLRIYAWQDVLETARLR
ncbi:MAG TPA: hypothetical protein VLV83_18545 [Acidobacteriota bacterium]|nr:hypothetical protein [Acidobacteriota bacterium]